MRNPVWKRTAVFSVSVFSLSAVLFFAMKAFGATAPTIATVYWTGNPEAKRIAITVDDCRSIDNMTKMLDLFRANDAKATFYVVGRNLRVKDRDFWRRVVAEGHELGNHTYGHVSLTSLPESEVKSQLSKTQTALNEALGFAYPLHSVRPPYGNWRRGATLRDVYRAGYDSVILWSVSQIDPDIAYEQIENGSVCLFHSNLNDLLCLETLVPRLRADGFELVTVSELFGFNPEREPSAALIP